MQALVHGTAVDMSKFQSAVQSATTLRPAESIVQDFPLSRSGLH
jgi:hypothetical protein